MNYKRYGHFHRVDATRPSNRDRIVSFAPLFSFLGLFLASFLWSTIFVQAPDPEANATALKTTSSPSLSFGLSTNAISMHVDSNGGAEPLTATITTDAPDGGKIRLSQPPHDLDKACLKHSSQATSGCTSIADDYKIPYSTSPSAANPGWCVQKPNRSCQMLGLISAIATTATGTDQATIWLQVNPGPSAALGAYTGAITLDAFAALPDSPTITGVYLADTTTAATGPASGGTQIDIIGTNLDTAYRVYVDLDNNASYDAGEDCSNADILSSAKITCAVPSASIAGAKAVVVETWGGEDSKSSGFVYASPDYCTDLAYATPPTGPPYDQAVMPLRHPQMGDVLDAGDTIYFNFPDDIYMEYIANGSLSGTHPFEIVNDDYTDAKYIYDFGLNNATPSNWFGVSGSYFSFSNVLDGANNYLYAWDGSHVLANYALAILSETPFDGVINEVKCNSWLLQYVWVDPWEVEYRNLWAGDDLTDKILYFAFPADFNYSMPPDGGDPSNYNNGDNPMLQMVDQFGNPIEYLVSWRQGDHAGITFKKGVYPTGGGLWADVTIYRADGVNSYPEENYQQLYLPSIGYTGGIIQWIRSDHPAMQYIKVKISDMP
jgi:hypothetical protein